MLVKATGTFDKHYTISTKGVGLRASQYVKYLIFYGKTLHAVNSWLTQQTKKTVLLEDEEVNVYHGTYTKMAYGKSEQLDPMMFRHAGFGAHAVAAAADQELAGAVAEAGLKATRALQERAFVAFVGARIGERSPDPKLMHNQKSIKLIRSVARGPEARAVLDISTGYMTLTVASALRTIADDESSPGDKFGAKMFLHMRGESWPK